ncbi:hypothetical protein B0H13DRAFT_2380457 [Mycena leptocephala]|nr:hypothetical protein B0H13DRAFT_2380457 [Mycena leptocephala]
MVILPEFRVVLRKPSREGSRPVVQNLPVYLEILGDEDIKKEKNLYRITNNSEHNKRGEEPGTCRVLKGSRARERGGDKDKNCAPPADTNQRKQSASAVVFLAASGVRAFVAAGRACAPRCPATYCCSYGQPSCPKERISAVLAPAPMDNDVEGDANRDTDGDSGYLDNWNDCDGDFLPPGQRRTHDDAALKRADTDSSQLHTRPCTLRMPTPHTTWGTTTPARSRVRTALHCAHTPKSVGLCYVLSPAYSSASLCPRSRCAAAPHTHRCGPATPQPLHTGTPARALAARPVRTCPPASRLTACSTSRGEAPIVASAADSQHDWAVVDNSSSLAAIRHSHLPERLNRAPSSTRSSIPSGHFCPLHPPAPAASAVQRRRAVVCSVATDSLQQQQYEPSPTLPTWDSPAHSPIVHTHALVHYAHRPHSQSFRHSAASAHSACACPLRTPHGAPPLRLALERSRLHARTAEHPSVLRPLACAQHCALTIPGQCSQRQSSRCRTLNTRSRLQPSHGQAHLKYTASTLWGLLHPQAGTPTAHRVHLHPPPIDDDPDGDADGDADADADRDSGYVDNGSDSDGDFVLPGRRRCSTAGGGNRGGRHAACVGVWRCLCLSCSGSDEGGRAIPGTGKRKPRRLSSNAWSCNCLGGRLPRAQNIARAPSPPIPPRSPHILTAVYLPSATVIHPALLFIMLCTAPTPLSVQYSRFRAVRDLPGLSALLPPLTFPVLNPTSPSPTGHNSHSQAGRSTHSPSESDWSSLSHSSYTKRNILAMGVSCSPSFISFGRDCRHSPSLPRRARARFPFFTPLIARHILTPSFSRRSPTAPSIAAQTCTPAAIAAREWLLSWFLGVPASPPHGARRDGGEGRRNEFWASAAAGFSGG